MTVSNWPWIRYLHVYSDKTVLGPDNNGIAIVSFHFIDHSNCLPGASQGSITVNLCQHSALTQLQKEIKDLEEKYGVLTDNALSALKKEHVSLDRIKSYLRQLPVSLKQQCHKFLQSQRLCLINAANIDELFWILSDYWDFINPSLLVNLAHKFGDDQTIASVDKYMKELKEFRMRTKLKDFINQWTGQPRPDFHEIVLEFKDDWREYTLEQLEEFRNAFLCKQWLAECYAMPLRGIKEACVAAVFSLPKAINSRDLENLRDFFQEHQILRVFLSGTCIINIQVYSICCWIAMCLSKRNARKLPKVACSCRCLLGIHLYLLAHSIIVSSSILQEVVFIQGYHISMRGEGELHQTLYVGIWKKSLLQNVWIWQVRLFWVWQAWVKCLF